MINLNKENTRETQIALRLHKYKLENALKEHLQQGYTFVAQIRCDFQERDESILILQKPPNVKIAKQD